MAIDKKLQKYILIPLFTFFWSKRLWYDHMYCPGNWRKAKVIKVKGWKTALVDQMCERMTITFLFSWEK